jgi:hypothetical protein
LGLLPGHLTPWLVAGLVRLGASAPFAEAAGLLAHFTGTTVSEATARRATEAAGAAWVQLELTAVAHLERASWEPVADPTPGPSVHQISVDGVLVPLVGGTWAEVKTLAIGAVGRDRAGAVQTSDLSYFARLADAETFGREALIEVQRRGLATRETVVAVADGAPWIQGFLDLHCPAAVRILDFPHAVGYLAQAAQDAFGPGTAAAGAWLATQAHDLKHGDPDEVLAELGALPAGVARDDAVRYLGERRAQIAYATFIANGFPIGSGCIESANKRVVQRRLKGAGMHWGRQHVNPMLGLRTVVANDRWATAWPQIARHLRAQARLGTAARRATRSAPTAAHATTVPPIPLPSGPASASPPVSAPPPSRPQLVVNGRPTSAHPWKRRLLPRPTAAPALPPKL